VHKDKESQALTAPLAKLARFKVTSEIINVALNTFKRFLKNHLNLDIFLPLSFFDDHVLPRAHVFMSQHF